MPASGVRGGGPGGGGGGGGERGGGRRRRCRGGSSGHRRGPPRATPRRRPPAGICGHAVAGFGRTAATLLVLARAAPPRLSCRRPKRARARSRAAGGDGHATAQASCPCRGPRRGCHSDLAPSGAPGRVRSGGRPPQGQGVFEREEGAGSWEGETPCTFACLGPQPFVMAVRPRLPPARVVSGAHMERLFVRGESGIASNHVHYATNPTIAAEVRSSFQDPRPVCGSWNAWKW